MIESIQKQVIRVAVIFFVILLLASSLITYPAHYPKLVFIWLSLSVWLARSYGTGWIALIGISMILLIKRPGFTVEFMVLFTSFLLVGGINGYFGSQTYYWIDLKRMPITLVLVAVSLFYGSERFDAVTRSQKLVLQPTSIACLGDSLTAFGYPAELAKLTTVSIIDFGVNGIRIDDGIRMLPEIIAAKPQAVVIELGGHDYNGDHKSRSETMANLRLLVESFHDADIEVFLMEIPRGFVTDPYDAMERELARDYDLELIPDSVIRNLIFNSLIIPPGSFRPAKDHLSDDGLHPNSNGNRYMAQLVLDALHRVYGDPILANE
ncbi:MAG: GDSL-type esterase/lipase family protein [Planctomycetota bacterium]